MATNQKPGRQMVVVVGAGPVGSLAALYAASRHDDVEIYDVRPDDVQYPSSLSPMFRKSINFTLSERGLRAMRQSKHECFVDAVMQTAIPMNGRMIHGKSASGRLQETFHTYDIDGNTVYSVERMALNKALRKALDETPNIKMYFNHRFVRADFCAQKAWFKQQEPSSPEVEVDFDFLIGADGVHSAVRYHMMKYAYTDYEQKYVDTRWCELRIPPSADGHFSLSPGQVHIWPSGDFMLVAFPCPDKSFNCTLFGPSAHLASIKHSPPAKLFSFFDTYFPGICPRMISRDSLMAQFHENPHLPLVTVKCNPHHFGSSVIIIGDAAHAILPFYGQGLNAGMEDVRVLFNLLEKKGVYATSDPQDRREALALAFQAYTAERVHDVHAIHDVAKRAYFEIRQGVNTPIYRIRKYIEDSLQRHVPRLGWQTMHSRISFTEQRYSEIVHTDERQGRILAAGVAFAFFLVVLIGVVIVSFLIDSLV
ncbi:FAD-dependent oxidoreductase [Aspergillus alliaceus]|uniref:FAD-dependent oxidoreductase n=1 Tax=Petromyces alliaceus TaxID=209559 RepID=UPI0012A53ACF|nr:kynurenine 3-monooxygenase [Aspergillus alliaceus]KAB8234505.1 kynurenine 3-monooxygenase [Aspergillus alliaceus]